MLRKSAAVLLSGSLFMLAGAGVSLAQSPAASPSAGSAGCFVSPAALPAGDISTFLASPAALLTDFPSGGLGMSGRVRGLAGTDESTLVPLIGLIGQASPPQVAAIGAGLARAARACAPIDPEYAAQIQDAVAGTDNTGFEAAFLGASGDTQTAALGAGAAAGAAAGAIGGGDTAGGGVNGTGDGTESVAAGDSAFDANASARYFATSSAARSTSTPVSASGSQ